MSPGITMFLGCCSLDPPSPRNPLTGCFFIAKLVKHIVQLSHRYFFFFSSSSFISVLLCFHSQHLLVRCFLSTVLCIFSASRNRKVGGGMMPFYFPGVQQTTVNNVCCVLQHSRSRQASYSSRDVRCSYPYFLLPLPFPLD